MNDASIKTTAPAKNDPQALKRAAVEQALAHIKKQFGDGAIMQMGAHSHANIPRFQSGSLSLDLALGGGIPYGRILEIYGPESSGKTTIALHGIAEVQRSGSSHGNGHC